MPTQISDENYPSVGGVTYAVRPFFWDVYILDQRTVLPSGALRIGGDSPNGLVLSGAAPVERTVDVFDRETKVLVASTVSGIDGTYAVTGLSARTDGYDVILRGNLLLGERDIIVPGVHPV